MEEIVSRTKLPSIALCAVVLMWAIVGNRAFAQTTEWRTQTQVSAGGGAYALNFASDGGLNEASSFATLSLYGSTPTASASLDAGGYIPTLRVFADAVSARSQAAAWGVQGYTNTSGSSLDTSLILNLSATMTGSGQNNLSGRVYLFKDENFEFYPSAGTILFESSSELWDGFETYANNAGDDGFDVLFNDYIGDVAETRSFDFTVAAGDSFYVFAQLVGTADFNGVVDAYSTLTASLTNTAGLSLATTVSPIPEPEVYAMLLAGLGLLGWHARRWKKQQLS